MYSDASFVKEHILLDQAEVRFRIETYFLVQIFKNNDSLIVFLCHINDLPDTVKSSVRLFADDCLLYWGMRFNATKCYIMSIKKKTHTFDQLGGHILEQVLKSISWTPNTNVSEDLKWSTHISNITKKANSTRNLQHCPKECRKNAYISLVRSVLEYEKMEPQYGTLTRKTTLRN